MKKIICMFLSLCFVFSLLPIGSAATFVFSDIPDYAGKPYVTVNGGKPFFTEADKTQRSFEKYAPLDALGRCGAAFACVGFELMPTEARGAIGSVKPSGWQYTKYDFVDGKYLFNRCHLIAFQLTGENANVCNLITGTRYMNTSGMLSFEEKTGNYIRNEHAKGRNVHVLYRVTPVFEGKDLVASGVLMEGLSVEDNGKSICFCVFCYNVQPGVEINYADGTSRLAPEDETDPPEKEIGGTSSTALVVNVSSKKFHLPDCASVKRMSAKNRRDVIASPQELIAEGYSPCANCRPDEAAVSRTINLRGDADADGKISAADARLALRAAVGLWQPSSAEISRIDVDSDGKVTASDARIILRAAVGLQKIA